MQSYSDPLNRLQEDAAWFARAHEIRLFVVHVSGDLRKAVLKLLPMFEFHADNKSPWISLDDAHTAEGEGWLERAQGLVDDWSRRCEAFKVEGIDLQPIRLPNGPQDTRNSYAKKPTNSSSLTREALVTIGTLEALLGALQAPLEGAVLILAPTVVEDVVRMERQLAEILVLPKLARARFVLVMDSDLPAPQVLLDGLGDRALSCRCVVDSEQQDKDILAMIDAPDPKLAGTAGPAGVTPPKRVDDPPELTGELKARRDEMLRDAGVHPDFPDAAPKLREHVMRAALSMKHGNGAEAVRHQRDAVELAKKLEMHQIKVICQIALASYLSGLDQPGLAIQELDEAVQDAADHDLGVQQSQGLLGLGLIHSLHGRLPEAANSYAEAARTADKAGVETLAMEAWRLAGQIALNADAEKQALKCFQEAIRLADRTSADAVALSSAPEAARQLAALCAKRGLSAQSQSLYDQADKMERGEVGIAAAPAAGQENSTNAGE